MVCCGCYGEYFANIERAKQLETALSKQSRAFKEHVERVKASTSGIGNVGLRELLMEPVQRIPRYTMMLDGILRLLPSPLDTDAGADAGGGAAAAEDILASRARLEEAVQLASQIASCEADEATKRLAILWSFARHVDDCPAELLHSPAAAMTTRELIDCVDVDDFPFEPLGGAATPSTTLFSPNANAGSTAAASSAGGGSQLSTTRTLHVTLFLFHDKLVVVKRSSAHVSARRSLGLDNPSRLADQMRAQVDKHGAAAAWASGSSSGSGGGLLLGRKSELSFRGMIDLHDLQASDLGGPDFHLAFFRTLAGASGERWTHRPQRQYAVVEPALDTSAAQAQALPPRMQKARFLDALWRAQALLKTRERRSYACSEIVAATHDPSDGSVLTPRQVIYWNIYTRESYLTETRKVSPHDGF